MGILFIASCLTLFSPKTRRACLRSTDGTGISCFSYCSFMGEILQRKPSIHDAVQSCLGRKPEYLLRFCGGCHEVASCICGARGYAESFSYGTCIALSPGSPSMPPQLSMPTQTVFLPWTLPILAVPVASFAAVEMKLSAYIPSSLWFVWPHSVGAPLGINAPRHSVVGRLFVVLSCSLLHWSYHFSGSCSQSLCTYFYKYPCELLVPGTRRKYRRSAGFGMATVARLHLLTSPLGELPRTRCKCLLLAPTMAKLRSGMPDKATRRALQVTAAVEFKYICGYARGLQR